jgi:preprotein translocase subunit YajC
MEILSLAMLQTTQRAGGTLIGMLPLIVLFFLFWVMIIVPQRRQAKEHLTMVQALQKGDQVVTAGGLVGVISSVRDDQVEVRTGTATVVVERSKISRRVDASASAGKA